MLGIANLLRIFPTIFAVIDPHASSAGLGEILDQVGHRGEADLLRANGRRRRSQWQPGDPQNHVEVVQFADQS